MLAVFAASAAQAQAPRPWEIGMQPAASQWKAEIIGLHDLVLAIITVITLFVGALLVVVMVRFRATDSGGPEDFMRTPLETLAEQIAGGALPVQVGKVFHLDDIVAAHRCMEENAAGGKIVVLTERAAPGAVPQPSAPKD
jgi:hypothetical protein